MATVILLWYSTSAANQLLQSKSCTDTFYAAFKQRIQLKRKVFAQSFKVSKAPEKVLDSARLYLENCVVDSMHGFWQNTPWNFYGTSRQPKCGTIACGYFVTGILADMDFKIPRVRWATVASETFIREFCGKNVKVFSNQSVEQVELAYKNRPGTIFVAGLDNHIGFFIHRDSFVFFHSNYYQPEIGVRMEPTDGKNPFAMSKYRAIGRLFDNEMVKAWLQGKVWK